MTVPAPTGVDVAAFVGRDDDAALTALADEQLPLVVAFVRAYTRGQGFDADLLEADLAAVVTTAAARLVTNPTGHVTESIDDYSVRYGPALNGWSLIELAVLHQYRRRTT